MLFFRSEDNARQWCQEKGIPMNPLVTIDQLWQMATTRKPDMALRLHSHRFEITLRRLLSEKLFAVVQIEGIHGFYHWSDAGVASWYDFAVAIQEEALEQAEEEKEEEFS